MDSNIVLYQTCIKRLLSQYTSRDTNGTKIALCFDDERKCYLVMRVGWSARYTRIHRCLIHIEITDDMIVIQANNTENAIDTDLINMGVPQEKLCLGFIPADFRAYATQQPRIDPDRDTASSTMADVHSSQPEKSRTPLMS